MTKTSNKPIQLLGILIAWAAFSTFASAALIVLDGNNPEPDEENILFGGDQIGMLITGATNQTNAIVEFESPSQFLTDPSNGQARVEARASNDVNSAQVAINDDLTVSLQNEDLAFRDLIFNAAIVGNFGSGGTFSVDVEGRNSNGDPIFQSFTTDENNNALTLGNGSNFFTVLASEGDLLTSVTINPDAGTSYADLRQIRISGVIPEPTSLLLMAIASSLIGLTRYGRGELT